MCYVFNSKQTTFVYGPEIYEKLILKDYLPYKMNENVDFSFINEVCKDLYPSNIDGSGVTCPAGNRTMISYYNKKTGTLLYHFKKSYCQNCSLKPKCTKLDHRTITVSKHYSIFEEAKRYSKSQDYKDDMKVRAHIEPKQGEMKRFHGLKRAKFWGIEKINIQAMLTGIVVNLKRFVKINSYSYRNLC